MRRRAVLLLAGASCLPLAGAPAVSSQETSPPQLVQVILRARIPVSGKAPELAGGGPPFLASSALPCFYERRGFAPAWSDGQELRRDVDDLLAAIEEAAGEGLNPEDYLLPDLRRRAGTAGRAPDPSQLAELDLLLTHASLTLGGHLRHGRVNPSAVYRDCVYESTEVDLPSLLQRGLDEGRVREVLEELAPSHPVYQGLKLARGFYRGIVALGGWPMLPAGPSLKPDARDPRVEALRARMEASAFVAGAPEGRDLYDAPLQAAVVAFQERNGLEPDGIVGPATLEALNVPADERLRQIEVNLERWRWLPRDLGRRYIAVNTAAFMLDVVEDGRTVLPMKVVVGKPATRTPMFTGRMTYLVLAPYWNVPPSIARNEILPRVKRDPGYLSRNGYEMSTTGGRVSIRQRPGANNALGRIKLMFPNRFNVYLHDTPSRSLFDRATRAFSHGCIRIEKPLELAEYLLRDQPEWTRERMLAVIAQGRERSVPLKEPLPVHVVYWTVWVDGAGVVQFRKDLYGRDAALAKALGLTTPSLTSPAPR